MTVLPSGDCISLLIRTVWSSSVRVMIRIEIGTYINNRWLWRDSSLHSLARLLPRYEISCHILAHPEFAHIGLCEVLIRVSDISRYVYVFYIARFIHGLKSSMGEVIEATCYTTTEVVDIGLDRLRIGVPYKD